MSLRGRARTLGGRRNGLAMRNPDPMFTLRHHHAGWVTDDEGNLVPVLHSVFHEPGVDLVNLFGDPAGNQTQGIKEGWVYLDDRDATEQDTPDNIGGYLREWDTDAGKVHHTTAWQTVEVLPGGELRWHTDQASYRAWLVKLVERGRISKPSRELVENLIDETRQQVANLVAVNQPAATAEADKLRKRITRLEEQLEATAVAQQPVARPRPAGKEKAA